MCSELGHRVSECKSVVNKCYKCGKSGHLVVDCKENMVTCYNYGEPGHINTHCTKPTQASIVGKVFALKGNQTSSDDRLIICICYINNTPLIAIIDIGATRSFIVADCVKRLGLVVSSMSGEMVIETPTKGSSVWFLTPGEEEETGFLSTRESKEHLEEEAQMFALFVALSTKSQAVIDELQVVRDFLEVFPYDILDVPLEIGGVFY
ncbi:uncharacterized protein LOC127123441 [Lathyrus oleraceus]|uniref:uncharacterized protein LOC127123441 n=1 Tax=Pisum sativum TaxID=3888 RepID=UPI0021D0E32A|nr:uncharacterized protein LOC127123441 [Pisum sativum]